MDYQELIKRGRIWRTNHHHRPGLYKPRCIIAEMSDAIETLLAEKKAVMEELRPGSCNTCKHESVLPSKLPCRHCVMCGGMSDNWELRGR